MGGRLARVFPPYRPYAHFPPLTDGCVVDKNDHGRRMGVARGAVVRRAHSLFCGRMAERYTRVVVNHGGYGPPGGLAIVVRVPYCPSSEFTNKLKLRGH